jgi:hypothetical protein
MLEGLNLGITRKEIKKKIEESKPKEKTLVFKTNSRANGAVDLNNDTAKHLDTMPKDRAVDLWKIYFIKPKLNEVQMKNYQEICKYLTQKYGLNLPKRK